MPLCHVKQFQETWNILSCMCVHTHTKSHNMYTYIIIFTTAYAEDCPDFELLVQIHCGVPAERDCILKRWVCDGYPDCPQENDESPATCQNSEFLLGL